MKAPTRTPSNLPRSVSQRLDAYAIAAAAANGDVCGLHIDSCHHSHWPYLLSGVGMLGLGLAVPSEAKIVYTPANHVISSDSNKTVTYPVDLNHDGIADVVFNQFCGGLAGHRNGCRFRVAGASSNGINGIEVGTKGHGWARAMKIGAHVGHARQFNQEALMAYRWESGFSTSRTWGTSGYWFHSGPRYLGVAFQIKGKIHYGWVRLKNSSEYGGTVTGYAYDTIPGRSMKAGQTKSTDDTSVEEQNAFVTSRAPQSATLGALATGAPGLSIWQRKESAGATVSS